MRSFMPTKNSMSSITVLVSRKRRTGKVHVGFLFITELVPVHRTENTGCECAHLISYLLRLMPSLVPTLAIGPVVVWAKLSS